MFSDGNGIYLPDDKNHQSKNIRAQEKGFALLIVIWGLALLAVIATTFVTSVNTQLRITRNVIDSTKAETLANAGVEISASKLVARTKGRSGSRLALRTDGSPMHCLVGEDTSLTLIVWDEGGKVDLNAASPALLKALLQNFENDPQKVAALSSAIVDFRDTNDLKTLNGAEAKEYAIANLPYGPKNARFDSVEELEQVIGLGGTLYQQILPFVTVYSQRNGIDPQVAPQALLGYLSRGSTGKQNSPPSIGRAGTSHKLKAHSVPLPYIAPSSQKHFRITAAVKTRSGGRYVRDAVIELKRLSNPPYIFKRWLRGRWPNTALQDAKLTEIECDRRQTISTSSDK